MSDKIQVLDSEVIEKNPVEFTEAFDHITEVSFQEMTDHEIEMLIDSLSAVLRFRRNKQEQEVE